MKHTLLFFMTAAAAAATLCSCESMRPNDNLQKVVSGDIFMNKPYDPKQEKALDDAAWAENQQYPRNYSVDPETENNKGRLAFEMPVR